MRPLDARLRQLVAGLIVGLATPAIQAQPADTLDWTRYYPLEVGNVWEYHQAETEDPFIRVTLLSDTTARGHTYFRRRTDSATRALFPTGTDTLRSTSFDYVRYDEGGVIAIPSSPSIRAPTTASSATCDGPLEPPARAHRLSSSPKPTRSMSKAPTPRCGHRPRWAATR